MENYKQSNLDIQNITVLSETISSLEEMAKQLYSIQDRLKMLSEKAGVKDEPPTKSNEMGEVRKTPETHSEHLNEFLFNANCTIDRINKRIAELERFI